jgi:hypothetical protein
MRRERFAHVIGAMAHHEHRAHGIQRLNRAEHMRNERTTRELVQDLRTFGLHARAFAGREDDDVQVVHGAVHGERNRSERP